MPIILDAGNIVTLVIMGILAAVIVGMLAASIWLEETRQAAIKDFVHWVINLGQWIMGFIQQQTRPCHAGRFNPAIPLHSLHRNSQPTSVWLISSSQDTSCSATSFDPTIKTSIQPSNNPNTDPSTHLQLPKQPPRAFSQEDLEYIV